MFNNNNKSLTNPIAYSVGKCAIAKARIANTAPADQADILKTTYYQDMWSLCGPDITLDQIGPYWNLSKDLAKLSGAAFADPDELTEDDYRSVCAVIRRNIKGVSDAMLLEAMVAFNREPVDVDYDINGLVKVKHWVEKDPTMDSVNNFGFVQNRYLINLLLSILDNIKNSIANYKQYMANSGIFVNRDRDGEFIEVHNGRLYF